MALEEVRDAELGTNEVVHEKFDALGREVGECEKTREEELQREEESSQLTFFGCLYKKL